MNQLDKKINKLIFINLLVLFIFLSWFFTEIPLKKWGNTKITTSNIIEAYILLKKDYFWQFALKKIKNISNLNLKEKFLNNYIKFIGVDQWHDPLYPYQHEAVLTLIDIYIKNQSWEKVKQFALKQMLIDPRDAYFYYLAGYSYQKQKDLKQAKEFYYKTLEIDSLHINTLKNLSQLLLEEGNYYSAKKILDHYAVISTFKNNEICFYWAEKDFSANDQTCSKIGLIVNQFTTNHIVLNSQLFQTINSLSRLRIDPPKGILKINYLKINTYTDPIIIQNFSKWSQSLNIIKEANGSYLTIGEDPYLHFKFAKPIPIKNIESIEIDFDHKTLNIDPEIEKILIILNSKI